MRVSTFSRGLGPALVAAGLVLGGGPALALEEKDVVAALTAALEAAGAANVAIESSATEGTSVSLSGVKVDAPVPRPFEASIGSIIVTEPAERSEGGFTAAQLSVTQGEIVQGDNRIAWPAATVERVIIPSAAEISGRSTADLFTRLTAEDLTLHLSANGKPSRIGAMTVEFGEVVDGFPRRFTVKMADVQTDTAVAGRIPRLKRLMENLGYSELQMNVTADLSYRPDAGTVGLESVDIEIVDFGTVRITGTTSGLPLDRLQSEASARDLVAGTRIDTLTVRFENAGLVERGLDKQAKLMGTTRGELQQQMAAAIPLFLNIIGNPAFQKRLAAPATAFLQEPRSITFRLAPDSPVEVLRVVSAALNAPKTLPDLLSVNVTAND